ncbi:hypothetical protein [Sporomusa malonica]|nr:hypothetical protein [Sporomusa malonica]
MSVPQSLEFMEDTTGGHLFIGGRNLSHCIAVRKICSRQELARHT